MQANSAPRPVRAVQYVRMSTEHQKYSIAFQSACNQAYALERGYELIRSYTDAGLSGLSLKRREGLQALLADVVAGAADFQVILVYDVSRWGRFQDPDESAHYEFICRAAGVAVEYCAEPFPNDGSLTSTLVKHIKRAMAAEYSRELSAKVSHAKRGLAREGYWCGAVPVYGFRRCILNPDGTLGQVLEAGERKALQGRRTVLVAGPPDEVAVVRRIFRSFVIEGLGPPAISSGLNADGVPAARGALWSRNRVGRILADEKYGGVLVQGRRIKTLDCEAPVPRDRWIRVPGGCTALVDPELAAIARANLRRARRAGSDESLLEALRRALKLHGRLSATLVRDTDFCSSPSIYCRRFGSLLEAYRRIGYEPSKLQSAMARRRAHERTPGPVVPPYALPDDELLARLGKLAARHGRLTGALIDEAEDLPSCSVIIRRFGGMLQLCARLAVEPGAAQVRAAAGNQTRKSGIRKVRLVTIELLRRPTA